MRLRFFGFFAVAFLRCVLCISLANLAMAKPALKSTSKPKQKSTQNPPTNASADSSSDFALKLTLKPEEMSASFVKNPHSLFVGAGLGYGLEIKNPLSAESSSNAAFAKVAKSTHQMLNIGFRAGYEYMPLALRRFLGLRVHLDYFLGIRPVGLETQTNSTFLANLNAQGKIYAFKNLEFGWVGGLGVGYGTHDKQFSTNDTQEANSDDGRGIFLGNVGIFGVLESRHRVEIFSQIPIKNFGETSKIYTYQSYSVLLMYDFLF